MQWGQFFTIVAQFIIVLVVLFVASAAVHAVIKGIRGK